MAMTKHVILSSLLIAAACGGAAHNAAEPEPSTGPAPTPAGPAVSNDDLASQGATLYGAHCAKCHGDKGQGGSKAPAVVGASALPKNPRPGSKRQVTFSTAYDIGAWAMEHMPGDKPGSLKQEEYLAILAFDLKANGVTLPAEPLTVEGLKAIVIHP